MNITSKKAAYFTIQYFGT